MLNHKQAIVFLFFEGFASIAIQFLILRQLTPFVGTSVIIVSIVISLFLAALALGYHKGGHVVVQHNKVLSYNLFVAASLLGIFGSYMFVSFIYMIFKDINPIITFVFYLLLIMMPIVYLVAQTIPILVNSMSSNIAGKKAGDALLFSTLGNVLGGLITTVLIMYFLGISWAIVMTVGILYILAYSISEKKNKLLMYLIFLFPIILITNIMYSSKVFVDQTSYANYAVYNDENNTYFFSNNSASSKIENKTKKGYDYLESIKDIIRIQSKIIKNPEILVIGAGGFTLTADNKIKGSITYVDIDKKIKNIVEKYFLKEKIKDNFVGNDARVFLSKSRKFYNFIIVDAYTNRHNIPENLTSLEFYNQVSSRLNKNGFAIINIIANPFLTDNFSKRIDNTIRKAFVNCLTTVIHPSTYNSNILYTCTNNFSYHKLKTDTVYRDNTNKSSIDYFMK